MEVRGMDEAGLRTIKPRAEDCPLCEGTGWKAISATSNTPENKSRDRRVVRCDCQVRVRSQNLLAAARIPKRYEHCELASYTTDFPGAHHSLEFAHLSASKFAQEYDPRDGTGLLIIGQIGTGKTHLAVGIIKELILNKGIPCLFYDYRELLKQIQNSYNATVQTTELPSFRQILRTSRRLARMVPFPLYALPRAPRPLATASASACVRAFMKCAGLSRWKAKTSARSSAAPASGRELTTETRSHGEFLFLFFLPVSVPPWWVPH